MAAFIVIREYRGPIGGKNVSFPEGKVLDDADYDVPLLQASGVRMVAFTQGLAKRIRGGDKHPGSALAALVGDGGGSVSTLSVQKGSGIPVSDQDGSAQRPFSSLQAAIDAVPVATDVEGMRVTHQIIVGLGSYDEDLSVDITGRRVWLVSEGGWGLGTFDSTGHDVSGTRRNIAITGDATGFDGIGAAFGVGSRLNQGIWSQTATVLETMAKVSGEITVDLSAGALSMFLECTISGDGTDSGDAFIVETGDSVTAYLFNCQIRGIISGDNMTLTQIVGGRLRGDLISVRRIGQMHAVDFFTAAITVVSSYFGFEPAGLTSCSFRNPLTWTGPAGSLRLDGYSNASLLDEGLTLAGGATKVPLYPLTAVFAGGAAAPSAGEHLEAQAGVGGASGVLGVATEVAAPVVGNVVKLAWNSATADATTIMKVVVNSAVVATVTLSGASGAVDVTEQPGIAVGDKVALEYDAGTAPGTITAQLFV